MLCHIPHLQQQFVCNINADDYPISVDVPETLLQQNSVEWLILSHSLIVLIFIGTCVHLIL